VRDKDTRFAGLRGDTPTKYRPPGIYQARLGELDRYHLEIACACGHQGNKPVSAYARFHGGPMQTLGDLLARLECSRCKARPATVLLNECMLKHFAFGPPRGWSVQVWPMNG